MSHTGFPLMEALWTKWLGCLGFIGSMVQSSRKLRRIQPYRRQMRPTVTFASLSHSLIAYRECNLTVRVARHLGSSFAYCKHGLLSPQPIA